MKTTLTLLTLGLSLSLAEAQEKVSREDALAVAEAVGADATRLRGTPITTDVDLEKPVAVRDEQYGGMVLPQKGLTNETLSGTGKEAVAIGQLWLRKLTPMRGGDAVPSRKLRLALVDVEGGEETVAQCTLAVRRDSGGRLELLVLGSSTEPIVTASLTAIDTRQSLPIDLDGERSGDSGKLRLRILGKYQAEIPVTELAI